MSLGERESGWGLCWSERTCGSSEAAQKASLIAVDAESSLGEEVAV